MAGKNSSNQDVARRIEELLHYAEQCELIQAMDVIPSRNALLALFDVDHPYEGDISSSVHIDEIMRDLLGYAVAQGLIPEDTVTQRDLFDAKVMGLLMPRASEVADRFWKLQHTEGVDAALKYFYQMSQDSRYIRMDRIALNQHWLAATDYGDLEVTINLSKPEKDPREIAAERSAVQVNYPQCVLCVDNVGYAGRVNHPARQNHRIIPLALQGERWYLQYSPYVYYNEHAIVLKEEHTPMQIGHHTFARLVDFVAQFPQYFIGSNADLPIVGGSILSHDHFQAGRHEFPMAMAKAERRFKHESFPAVTAGIVDWPMSVIRLASANREALLQLANQILDQWREYSDEAVEVVAYSGEVLPEDDSAADSGADTAAGYSHAAAETIPHNTITPIARMNAAGQYELDLVLRNNRTTDEHPLGLFHPHASLHHIKKENIGLIEVMGLAILPGRLLGEIGEIMAILTGNKDVDSRIAEDEAHALHKHAAWIDELLSEYGTSLNADEAEQVMKQAVGDKFLDVLLDAGVFKRDSAGQAAFERFMASAGFE